VNIVDVTETTSSVVQDTILKTVSYCIFKIQDTILSGILRYLFIVLVSYLSIFKILFKRIFGKCKILFQDTFPKILYLAQNVHFATFTY